MNTKYEFSISTSKSMYSKVFSNLCEVLKVCVIDTYSIILDSSMVEHSAVNRVVVGSSPTRGVFLCKYCYGSVVKRSRHRPFTAVTRVRFPSESLPFWFGPLAQLVRATGS